ncbi:peptidyl-prolyl cis-trans isomerase [Litorisediminicola beolgyonensis]|uniref:Parvulin-like PPIase n=1 Tax=Litorisediminicola beolgyonensis TaxID=1173614 RepID=A0ABW3ZGF9_9RHOB
MALKVRRLSTVFVWILMGLLLLGLAGFGATSLSGTARSVASVGDKDVAIQRYATALQNRMRQVQSQVGQPVSMTQAQQMGLDTQVLSELIVNRAFDWEADRIGLSVGDAELVKALRAIPAFQGADGAFNRDAYSFALDRANLSESQFEEDLRGDTARSILQGAIVAGVSMPDTYAQTLVGFANQTRDFTWALLERPELDTGLAEPTEDELQAYYDANVDSYIRPETRDITYAWLTPDMMLDTVEVPEADLRAAYAEREAEFNMPERRLVERLIFPSEEAAASARSRLDAGEISFDDLVEERGLTLSDVDLGIQSRADLGDAAETVFSVPAGEVAGPAPTSLGPALFRVNAELAAQETPFEEAQEVLRDSLALDRARQVIDAQIEDLDDRLAGGATLEELADETEMQLGQIGWTGAAEDGLAGYPEFAEAADAATESDFPTITRLGDGGVFAFRLDEIKPAAPRPLDEVRDQVRTGWERQQITEELEAQAEALVARLEAGESFEEVGLEPTSQSGFRRSDSVDVLPGGATARVFRLETEGDIAVVSDPGRVAILRLDAVIPADLESVEAQALAERLRDEAAQEQADALFRALAADIQTRAGVSVNQTALNSVNSQLQ